MQISLTGRHVEISAALREHVEERLEKLSAYNDSIMDVRVVLSVEKHRSFSVEKHKSFAEITISERGATKIHSHEATDDMFVSIDKAVEKIERQLKRHISKKRSAKRRKDDSIGTPEEALDDEPSDQGNSFESHGEYRVTISEEFPPKPMSVEDALALLETSEMEFQAFVNEETDEVNVVFRQREGGYGLLRRSF